MISIILSIAFITLWFVALAFVIYRQSNQIGKIEEIQIKQIASAAEAKKDADQRIDNIITAHNATVSRYDERLDEKDDEVKMIISRLDQIAADIARMDSMTAQDHRDLVDIRMRYINYRTPVQSKGGVDWAEKIRSSEDL